MGNIPRFSSKWTRIALFVFITTTAFSCSSRAPADLVLLGGKVVTVDENFSFQEGVAVRKGRIVSVGSLEDIESFIGAKTQVFDLKGKLVLPGLIDSHAHMYSLGQELSNLNITGTGSFEEIIAKVAERVRMLPPGEWIVGGRWDQNDWEVTDFPVHDLLSAVSPENPVYLRRVDGNAAFANLKALELAGIDRETPDPYGGVIHRKDNGEPTGVLINRAMNRVEAVIPEDSKEKYKEKVLRAVESCLSVGLTSWHEAGISPEEIGIYKELIDEKKLKMRVSAMLGEQENPEVEGDLVSYLLENRIENYGDSYLSVRSVKLFFDGALGSRGAAFFDPYEDDPGNTGLLRITPEYIYQVTKAALSVEMGVCTHCIGIRGNRLCLDAYEKALLENPKKDHRLRIEHAQIVRDEDVEKFASLQIIPAMQPTHCTSDMPYVESRIGYERAKGAYAWRSFLDAGLVIPFGSDFPVESNNPLLGLYAAVTRQNPFADPEGGWFPEQRVEIEEAIKGFTIWAAYAAFQEDELGSIETGKLADFTVLDTDILQVAPVDILKAKVFLTIVGGQVVFERH